MQKVSTFLNVRVGNQRYAFLLVSQTDYEDPVRDEIERQLEPFGADLKEHGTVIQAFTRRSDDVAREVALKSWDEEDYQRIAGEQDPFLLIVETDFAEFDPQQDPWAIIWFSEFAAEPRNVRKLFAALAAKTRAGEDIVGYLRDVSYREQAAGAASRFSRYVEIKPRLFGVSVDVGAILRDLTSR